MTTLSRISSRGDRRQIVRERRKPLVVEACRRSRRMRPADSSAPSGSPNASSSRRGTRRRPSEGAICVEIVQETVDGRGLLRRFGDVAAHQFACPPDGFGTDVLTQLTDQLCTQQLDLLAALHLDPLTSASAWARSCSPMRLASDCASSMIRLASALASSFAFSCARLASASRSAAAAESANC